MNWIWVSLEVALAAHHEQLAEHGGGVGLREAAMLESAMARPQNRAAYGNPDAADLAAAYAFGIARNHPFIDGNKRAALVVSETFLTLNRYAITAPDPELVTVFMILASGEFNEIELSSWFRDNCLHSI
jgi:death on curing protein